MVSRLATSSCTPLSHLLPALRATARDSPLSRTVHKLLYGQELVAFDPIKVIADFVRARAVASLLEMSLAEFELAIVMLECRGKSVFPIVFLRFAHDADGACRCRRSIHLVRRNGETCLALDGLIGTGRCGLSRHHAEGLLCVGHLRLDATISGRMPDKSSAYSGDWVSSSVGQGFVPLTRCLR